MFADLVGAADRSVRVHRVPPDVHADKTNGRLLEWLKPLPGLVVTITDPRTGREFTHHNTEEEPGRNERCPCGSGKKYKRCCGDPVRQN